MEPEQFYDMSFPLGGLDNSRAFSDAKPNPSPSGEYLRTAQEAMNVRGYEPGTQRARGGARPGMAKYISAAVVADWIIQDLNIVVVTGDAAKV